MAKERTNLFVQVIFGIVIVSAILILINNLAINLFRSQIGIDFRWLTNPSGFALSETVLPYSPSDSYAWALFIGWLNSLKVIGLSLIFSTIIGLIVGFSRFSKNPLVKFMSRLYVALIRQIPLLLQLLFWYFVGILSLSNKGIKIFNGIINMSNQGLEVMGLILSPEFTALLIGLSVFTGASIAEVIRGGINSVYRGQWEAFRSIGISEWHGLRLIIFPQALPAIIPGLTSQYLNLAKNSTLAIAIGYADIYAVSDTSITQTGRAVEGFAILIISFLSLNLIITKLMEIVNSLAIRKSNRT